MNGSDKHHMEVMESDDGGHVMCLGCKAQGNGFKYRPPGECPTPWLDRKQLLEQLAKAKQRNVALADTLRKFLDFVEGAPVGSGVCCCGDAMVPAHHGDHGAVDMWDHNVSLWGKEIEELLKP